MGITLGNLRHVHIEDIMDFKEHLSTLLVSMLFVVLAARLHWPLPPGMLMAGIVVFVMAQFFIRPVSILVSSFGSTLSWPERALIAWVSPRGMVAASVSSLFALRLGDLGVPGADALVPLVFTLIIGTVVLQSATARPLARWLKVAEPDPDGVLIFGSDEVARGDRHGADGTKVPGAVGGRRLGWHPQGAHGRGCRCFSATPLRSMRPRTST